MPNLWLQSFSSASCANSIASNATLTSRHKLSIATPIRLATYALSGVRPEPSLSTQRTVPRCSRPPARKVAARPPFAPVELETAHATGRLDLDLEAAHRTFLIPGHPRPWESSTQEEVLQPVSPENCFPDVSLESRVLVRPAIQRRRVHAGTSGGIVYGVAALYEAQNPVPCTDGILGGPPTPLWGSPLRSH